jgi:hypothetical protein
MVCFFVPNRALQNENICAKKNMPDSFGGYDTHRSRIAPLLRVMTGLLFTTAFEGKNAISFKLHHPVPLRTASKGERGVP